MSKTIAVLLDGGFVCKRLATLLGLNRAVNARELEDFARGLVREGEELFRIYYYDCPPYGETVTNPISGQTRVLVDTKTFRGRTKFLALLASTDHFAFRRGELTFRGWRLKRPTTRRLIEGCDAEYQVTAEDIEMDLQQKKVDMKIGLDVAWLASKRIVDRIVLCTGDSDFVPAMKFARREGVQVVLVPMEGTVKKELLEHADEVRHWDTVPPPGPDSP